MWSFTSLLEDRLTVNVLDVGSSLGEQPRYQRLVEMGWANIVGFEPDPSECERLRQHYGASHRFFPHFVGRGGPATYYQTNNVFTGSLFEPNSELLDYFQNLAEASVLVARHPVTTTRLDDVPDLPMVDHIKIDVQGSELDVFEGGTRTLQSALFIETEVEFVELYKGQPMFADVDRFLRSQGFQFHTLIGYGSRAFKPLIRDGNVNMGFRQALWADAIYARDWMRLELLTPLQLKKYALLAHDVIESPDLAHLALLEFDKQERQGLAQRYLDRLVQG